MLVLTGDKEQSMHRASASAVGSVGDGLSPLELEEELEAAAAAEAAAEAVPMDTRGDGEAAMDTSADLRSAAAAQEGMLVPPQSERWSKKKCHGEDKGKRSVFAVHFLTL
jgi:hypothetical protein